MSGIRECATFAAHIVHLHTSNTYTMDRIVFYPVFAHTEIMLPFAIFCTVLAIGSLTLMEKVKWGPYIAFKQWIATFPAVAGNLIQVLVYLVYTAIVFVVVIGIMYLITFKPWKKSERRFKGKDPFVDP